GPNGGQIYIDGFTGGTLPPKSSIREIRINQNPFSAQYDQLGYGRVGVFTKPGTDKFHGHLGFNYNHKLLNTSSPFLRARSDPRVDSALGSRNTLTARFQYENGSRTTSGGGIALPTLGYTTSDSESTIQISDTQLISDRVINETRFEYQRTPSSIVPVSTVPKVVVQGIFTAGGSDGGNINSTLQQHYEVQNYTSIALSKNFIRFVGRLR